MDKKSDRHAQRTYNAMAGVRVVWSLAWAIAVCVWSDRAALFFSGALVATHMGAAFWLLLALTRRAVPAVADARALWTRLVLVAIAVADCVALIFLALYGVNIYGAGLRAESLPVPCAPAATTAVDKLSCAMWVDEPGLVIAVLVALGVTLLLHLASLGLGIVHLRRLDAFSVY